MSNANDDALAAVEAQRMPDVQSILAAIVESTDDAIYSKDSNARVTSWNSAAEALYGYKAEDVIGQDIAVIIPPARKGEEREILDQILSGGRVDHYETTRQRKDGTFVDVSLTVSPVRDLSGVIVGASVIARDVTELKRREELEREIEKRDFIARAAHELKNPLTTISGMAHVLQKNRETLSGPDADKAYATLIRQSERASRLINDLLELARLDSGQLEVEVVSADLHDIVGSSIAAAALGQVPVSNGVPPGTVVRADPFRLEEVFVNLFSNSAKYGASTITVGASIGAGVEVEIADDGPGIPEELHPVLFEPFTRASKTGVAGSGLGLSIAKRLCQMFEGDITFDPTAPQGARFVLSLLPG